MNETKNSTDVNERHFRQWQRVAAEIFQRISRIRIYANDIIFYNPFAFASPARENKNKQTTLD